MLKRMYSRCRKKEAWLNSFRSTELERFHAIYNENEIAQLPYKEYLQG